MSSQQDNRQAAKTCEFCLFSSRESKVLNQPMLCHRYPPVPIPHQGQGGSIGITGFWPPVSKGEWCGEFRYGLKAETGTYDFSEKGEIQ